MKLRTVLFPVIALFPLLSCGSRKVSAQLDDIESYIQERPDSALAILQAIDTNSLNTRALEAKYSLLHAMALDKNYIDTTDIGVISAAIRFYGKHGPDSSYARALYYQGRIYMNARKYPEALLAFDDAVEEAVKVPDYHYLGLISISQAIIYNRQYNGEADIEHSKQAVEWLSKDDDKQLYSKSLYFYGVALFNNKDYASAREILLSAKDAFIEVGDSYMTGRALLQLAAICMERDNDYARAVRIYSEVLHDHSDVGLTDVDKGRFAYALFKTGDDKASKQILDRINKTVVKENWLYRINLDSGHEHEGLDYLQLSLTHQNDVVRQLLRESATTAMKDYYRMESLEKEKALQKMRSNAFMMSLGVLILLIVAYFIFLNSRKKQKEQNLKIIELSSALDDIRITHENEVYLMRNRLRASFAKHFTLLRDIAVFDEFNDNFDYGKAKEIVNALLDEIRNSSGKDSVFEKMIDEELDGFMTRLRSQMPKFSEEDYRLLSFLAVGFDTRLIAELLNHDRQYIYLRKSRLAARIERTGTEDADFFLNIIR